MNETTKQILDELDQSWREGKPPDLALLVQRLRSQGDHSGCVELCAADLEWRWRASRSASLSQLRSPSFRTRGSHISANQYGDNSEVIDIGSRLNEYKKLLGDIMDEGPHCLRLLEADFLARSRWGDAPNIDKFLREVRRSVQFEPVLRPELAGVDWISFAHELAAQLDHLAQIRVVVLRGDELLIAARVSPQFEIGRQDRNEPAPPAWLAQSNRLIVAPYANRGLSRQQFTVRRSGIHEMALSSRSSNAVLKLDKTRLEPNQASHLHTPVSISVDDLIIEVQTIS